MIGDVTLVGLEELRRTLRKVDRDLPKQIITPTFRDVARELILPVAKAATPVGDTGRLRRSVRVLASQRRVALKAGRKGVSYARFVHDGTRHIKANPFLDRVVDTQRRFFVDAVDDELGRRLQQRGLTVR